MTRPAPESGIDMPPNKVIVPCNVMPVTICSVNKGKAPASPQRTNEFIAITAAVLLLYVSVMYAIHELKTHNMPIEKHMAPMHGTIQCTCGNGAVQPKRNSPIGTRKVENRPERIRSSGECLFISYARLYSVFWIQSDTNAVDKQNPAITAKYV